MSIYLHKVKSRWQPGGDTLAYYPLNSTSTVNDMKTSGTKYNLTNYNILFGTYQGVDCAYFNSANSRSGLYYSGTQIIPSGDFTWNVWMYLISTSTDNPRLCSSYVGGNNYGILLNSGGNIVVWSTSSTTGIPTTTGGWHLYTVVGNFSQGSYKGYVDGVLSNTWSGTGISSGTGLNIGGFDQAGSGSATSDKLNGYLSERILENKQWSDDDVMDYYMLTKGDYHTEAHWEVNENTLAYYPLDSDSALSDESGNNRDATGSSNITYETISSGRSVTKLTSDNAGIAIPGNIANLLNGDFTISFWLYLTGTSSSYTMAFGAWYDVSPYVGPNIWVRTSSNNIQFRLAEQSGGYVNSQKTYTYLQNKWTHICRTRTNGLNNCYIDGILDCSFTSSLYTSSGNAGYILSRYGSNQSLTSGSMGSAYIIENRGWSTDEVLSYYYQTRNDYVDNPWYPVKEYEVQNIYIGDIGWKPGENTIAYYEFNDNINDTSGNSRNLSMKNGSFTYGTIGEYKYVNIPQSAWTYGLSSFPFDINSNTVSFWIKNPYYTKSDSNAMVADFWRGGSYGTSRLCTYSGAIKIDNVSYTISDDTKRYYVCIVYNNGQTNLYVNGEYIGANTCGLASGTTSVSFALNNAPDTNSSTYSGQCQMSQLIFESVKRTAEDIQKYYNKTKSNYGL